MTEHNPPEDSPPEPTNDNAPEATTPEEVAEAPTVLDESVSDDELLAAAEEPYTAPEESAAAHEPPHQAPPHQPPPDPQGADAQGPYLPPTPQRRLFRSRNDRKLGGVAGGIARYLEVDPTVVRIVFVVLALTGTSILVYLAAWILMPEHPAGHPEPVWRERATDRNLAIAVGLASLGLAVAILNESWLVLAIVLIAGGIWLLSEQPLAKTANWTSPVPPAPNTDAAASYQQPVYATAGAPAGPTAPQSGWGWEPSSTTPGFETAAPTPPPQRRPQRITRGVLSLLAILAAIAIGASAGDWWDVSGTRMLGIAILVIGAGVLGGALTKGGARGLIPLGVLAVILLIPVTAVDGLVDAGVGSATYRPLTVDALQADYEHGVGELLIDLSGLDLDGISRDVDIDLGMGELTLILPDDVGGTLDLESKAGELIVNLPGSGSDLSVEGINQLPDTLRLPGDRGELTLTVDVGLGVVDVRGN